MAKHMRGSDCEHCFETMELRGSIVENLFYTCEIGAWHDKRKCTKTGCLNYKPCSMPHITKKQLPPKKIKPDPQSVIKCGSLGDTHLAYIAMFRYAFGRMTYLPNVVIGIFKLNAKNLADNTLKQLDRELAEQAEYYERRYTNVPNTGGNYGMECDRRNWLAFHEWVKEQIEMRKGVDNE